MHTQSYICLSLFLEQSPFFLVDSGLRYQFKYVLSEKNSNIRAIRY